MSDEIKTTSQDTSTQQQVETGELYTFVKDYIKDYVDGKFENIKPQIDSKVDSFVSKFKEKIDDDISNTKDELNKVKNNITNTLAIFAAFFTFISTSFNIFSLNISIYSAMSLAVILWLLLIGFAYLVNIFISRDHTSIKAWIPVILLALLSLAILFSNFKFHHSNNSSINTTNSTETPNDKNH